MRDLPGVRVDVRGVLVSQTPHADRFHAHLGRCEQCREHPLDMCPIGGQLLQATVGDAPVFSTAPDDPPAFLDPIPEDPQW